MARAARALAALAVCAAVEGFGHRLAVAPVLTRRRVPARARAAAQGSPAAPLRIWRLAKLAEGDAWVDSVACGVGDAECYAVCDAEECAIVGKTAVWDRLKITLYFGLWYVLSIGYSITNKRVTNALPMPWSVAAAVALVGSLFVQLLWATRLRAPPTIPRAAWRTLIPIGFFHAVGHIAGTVGTAAGSVAFAQVVKSTGPVYACILSSLVLRQAVSARVWLSLLPIVGGVGLATLTELSFTWAALLGAVVSDLGLALRNVYSKASMGEPLGENMTPANHFGVLTCLATIIAIPCALVLEGRALGPAWRAAAPTQAAARELLTQIGLTGLYFYGYSEVAMKALNNVHSVTHAIGNTLRRVIIMLVCMVVFRTPVTRLGALGSALAIGGSYV